MHKICMYDKQVEIEQHVWNQFFITIKFSMGQQNAINALTGIGVLNCPNNLVCQPLWFDWLSMENKVSCSCSIIHNSNIATR
jgi:hypothetical protein